MTKYTSRTIQTSNINTNLEVSESFEIDSGTETMSITDELLTNSDVAKSKARALFLKNGYITKIIKIETYLTQSMEIYLGEQISVDNTLYKIVKLRIVINGAKVILEVTGERWEHVN